MLAENTAYNIGSRPMKWLTAILILLLVALQYRLWAGDGGFSDVRTLNIEVKKQRSNNAQLKERNQALEAEVKDLKQGLEAVEERARSELGMIKKKNETFYQVVEE